MKIVQILPSLDVGGMERLVVAIVRQQQLEGHQPILYCTTHAGAMASQVERLGVPLIAFDKGPGFSLSLVRAIQKQLLADQPDVVHTHNALVHHYGVIASRLASVPVVVNTRHGYGSFGWDRKRETIFNAMARWTDAIVMVSRGVQDYFVTERRIDRGRTHVILNGTNLDPFLAHPALPGSHRPVFRFGTVGRLNVAKNHVLLVQAFAKILPQLPNAELHILGEGECRPQIEAQIAELGVADRVVLHGYSDDVPGFLERLDAFVLSSSSEGLPLAVLEAMAAGLPIVSTRLPGVEEVAPEGRVAWYSRLEDADDLARMMMRVASLSDLSAVGGVSRIQSRQFGIADMWHRYQQLFEDLLRAKRGYSGVAA